MDFHWWMLLPLIPLAAGGLVVIKVVRVRRRGREFLRLSRSERLELARALIRDRDLPLFPRALAAGAAAYLALPIDLIPDFVPIVGHADDFLVVTLLIAVMARVLPGEEFDEAVRRARQGPPAARALPVN